MVIVRFAPSPTGYLHLGNLRTALLNWLCARQQKGKFYLRFDDTDMQRSKKIFVDQIIRDFEMLNLTLDGIYKQSCRQDRYEKTFNELLEKKCIYSCYETVEELEIKRKKLHLKGLPPIYDRASLHLSQEEKNAYENQGRKPYYRFLLHSNDVQWDDGIRGLQKISLKTLSDPVIRREDGSFLYTFTSVVDDVDLGITHIIRGEDHVTNTAVQIDMFHRIKGVAPHFSHHNLLVSSTGEGLSKRLSSLSIKELLENNFEPDTLSNYVTYIGSAHAPDPKLTLSDMVDNFSLSRYSRSSAHTNIENIRSLNAQKIQFLSDDEVVLRLKQNGYFSEDALAIWQVVKGNCIVFNDMFDMLNIIKGTIETVIDDSDYCQKAIQALPEQPWDTKSFKQWTHNISSLTGYKGKALFMPLRLALTGKESGPELSSIFPFMDKAIIIERLSGKKN